MSEAAADLLDPAAIRLEARAPDRETAIRLCGQALVDTGAVEPGYIDTMLEREKSVSTYIGEGVAIPHGTLAARGVVRRDALCFLRFPDGIDWGGERVSVCIGIAAAGNGHVAILAQLAEILMDPDRAAALRGAADPAEVSRLLEPTEEDDSE
ncbi:MAG TPA: PTS sugar transporter subunit IIA [Streptosporangiaceae bacterium]|jgi:PTS system mannitol-specific IIA component|nr:PTS sugar transporter subunit IIA [Streptosporangiaceae bacterium]